MRKILKLSALATLLMTVGTGCLKDQDFEDEKYGIQIKEEKSVSFPQSSSSPIIVGIVSQSTAQTIDGPLLALNQTGMAAAPVTVTVAFNDALVTAEGLTLLPVGSYALNSLTPKVDAGTNVTDAIKITFPNAQALDASKSYGIGLTITGADQGYKVAANQKNVVIAINIKNTWAADYDVTGRFFHPTGPRDIDDVKTLVTVSPVTSRAPHSDLYPSNYYFDFDVSGTNTLVNYVARGATTGGGFMTLDNPGGAPFPLDPVQPGQSPWLSSTYNNTYVPGTKTFWMHYGYISTSSANQNDYSRQIYEKWVRH